MSFFREGDLELSYDRSGESGDPVALIHGSLVDGSAWYALAPALASSFAVVSYDRRGYGGSRGARRSAAVRDDADDLARLLESIDLFPVHLVAHSYGGAVAFRLAADRPELVRSIAVHEPPMVRLVEHDPELGPEARRWIAGAEQIRALVAAGDSESAAREVVDAFSSRAGAWDRLRPEIRRQALAYIPLWSEEFRDLEAIRSRSIEDDELWIPVLVTTGENSPPIVRGIARELARSMKNATLRSIPDAGHAPHLTAPDRYGAILASFLLERNVPPT